MKTNYRFKFKWLLIPLMLLYFPLLAQNNITVTTTPTSTFSIMFDPTASHNLVPIFINMTVQFKNRVDILFLRDASGKTFPFMNVAKGSNQFSILSSQIGDSLKAGNEFCMFWIDTSKKDTNRTKMVIYPIPEIKLFSTEPKLGEDIIYEVGPFLRNPDELVFYPKNGIGSPAEIRRIEREWKKENPTMLLGCRFIDQPNKYKFIITDRKEPSSLLYPNPVSNRISIVRQNESTELFPTESNLVPPTMPIIRIFSNGQDIKILREKDIVDNVQIEGLDSTSAATMNLLKRINTEIKTHDKIILFDKDHLDSRVAIISKFGDHYKIDAEKTCEKCVIKEDDASGKTQGYDVILSIFKLPDYGFYTDKKYLFPGDSLMLTLYGYNNQNLVLIPTLADGKEEVNFVREKSIYKATIPKTFKSGQYPIYWKTKYSSLPINTGEIITINEFSVIEDLNKYVSLSPQNIYSNDNHPVYISKEETKNIEIILNRDSISYYYGPQFIKIKMTIKNKDGNILSTKELKTVTFNPKDPRGRDEINGPYVQYLNSLNLKTKSFEKMSKLSFSLDDPPVWSYIYIEIIPDPDMNINNIGYGLPIEYKRVYCVKGSWLQVAPSIGAPKIIWPIKLHKEKDKNDSLNYGSASLMFKLYHIDDFGKRWFYSLGVGIYGFDILTNKTQDGGIPISLSIDLLDLFNRLKIEIASMIRFSVDVSLYFPFNYPYARLLVGGSISISP
jgi:hypothetical protein